MSAYITTEFNSSEGSWDVYRDTSPDEDGVRLARFWVECLGVEVAESAARRFAWQINTVLVLRDRRQEEER
jgi:hypothetical protein